MKTKDILDEEYYAELYQTQLAYQEFFDNECDEFFHTEPIYSRNDISLAIQYASNSITLDPNEIGKDVYDELYNEKINEYLNSINK